MTTQSEIDARKAALRLRPRCPDGHALDESRRCIYLCNSWSNELSSQRAERERIEAARVEKARVEAEAQEQAAEVAREQAAEVAREQAAQFKSETILHEDEDPSPILTRHDLSIVRAQLKKMVEFGLPGGLTLTEEFIRDSSDLEDRREINEGLGIQEIVRDEWEDFDRRCDRAIQRGHKRPRVDLSEPAEWITVLALGKEATQNLSSSGTDIFWSVEPVPRRVEVCHHQQHKHIIRDTFAMVACVRTRGCLSLVQITRNHTRIWIADLREAPGFCQKYLDWVGPQEYTGNRLFSVPEDLPMKLIYDMPNL